MKTVGAAAMAAGALQAQDYRGRIAIDPAPRYELSPYLYMQFMEPLGTTDGSVSAGWNYLEHHWRSDLIEITQHLAPTMVRWGGCLVDYYRWREGVGPRGERVPMVNMLWGGMEPNQVGTYEFVDFCQQVGAEPLICVNFESDGREYWRRTPDGDIREADAQEAADWVAYCNDPDNAERRAHGHDEPYGVRLWQIGNETSYDRNAFDVETAANKTIEFAQAMRRADADIEIIGWGDSGWGPKMIEMAGEHLQYIAFHHMFNPDGGGEDSPLQGTRYRDDPAATWESLMEAWRPHEAKIRSVREEVAGHDIPLAMTECHFALSGRNRCEVLSSWAAGVSYARLANVHERHGDVLKIATLADFCGTRWQVNAVMIPVPGGPSFLMPVARVMRLYRLHTGEQAVEVTGCPPELDITASRTGDRVFLHVVNTRRAEPIEAQLTIAGMGIDSGRVFEIAGDPEAEIVRREPDVLSETERELPANGRWTFPAASVSAVELDVRT